MPSPRILLAATGAVLLATALIQTPRAEARTGCCMIRADLSSEWLQSSESFSQCKKRNAEVDGKRDNPLKKVGRVWWNLRC